MEDIHLKIFFSSDALYLQSIFKDVFIDGTGVGGWNINAAPNFFPDMLLYFILNGIVGDFKIASFLFSFIQYSVILMLIYLLFRAFSKSSAFLYSSVSMLFLSLFLLVRLISGDLVYTSYLLLSAYHLGSFVMTLACLTLSIYYLKSGFKSYVFWLNLLGWLGTLSDRLFIIQYTIPVLFAFAFTWKHIDQKRLKAILYSIFGFTTLGLITLKIFDWSNAITIINTGWKMFNFSNIGNSLNVFLEQHLRYLELMDLRGIINVLSIISLVLISFLAVRFLKGHFISSNTYDKDKFLINFFILYAFGYTWLVLLTPIINGAYVGWAILRFNIYSFYMLLILFGFYGFMIFKLKNSRFTLIINSAAIIFIIVIGVKLTTMAEIKSGLNYYFNYYPKTTECLDRVIEEENLQFGVAHYWDAKFNMMFSKKDIRLYPVYPNYDAYHHATNKNWFYDTGKGKFGHPIFDFVFVSESLMPEVENRFGNIKKIIKCPDNKVVCIVEPFQYNRTNRRLIPGN